MTTIQEKGAGKKRIVIVGAGFAGLHTYMELHKQFHKRDDVFITLINKNDYFLFKPMIHEVAIGNLLPGSITQSIRILPQCCLDDFIEGEVLSVDFDKQEVIYRNPHVLDEHYDHVLDGKVLYDYLVLAPGSTTNYFDTEGAEEHAISMKDLDDARYIKNHILHRFEDAQKTVSEDEKKKLLTFLIVGGGASGVELAGEMSDLFNKELRDVYPDLHPLSSVEIVQGGSQLISPNEEWLAKKTQKILERSGKVRIILNARVTKVDEDGVMVGDRRITSGTVIWAAGVRVHGIKIISSKDVEREDRSGRIKTNRGMSIHSYKNVFVCGDSAFIPHRDDNEKSYPMRAQFAVKQGPVVARNIKNLIEGSSDMEAFHAEDEGFIISLGHGGALARIFGVKFSGFIAWWIYRTAYLSKIFGARAKMRTALEWTLNLFLPRDLSEL